MDTKPNVFIIESLEREDENKHRFEGEILSRILSLRRKKSEYRYIRTKLELKEMLDEFLASDMRYLHLSCHGDKEGINLTYESIPTDIFIKMVAKYLDRRRLFLSACEVSTKKFTESLIVDSNCTSVVGPKGIIYFDDAAVMWASFYHLMFEKNPQSMKNKDVIDSLQVIANTFGFSVRGSFRWKDSQIISGVIKPKPKGVGEIIPTA